MLALGYRSLVLDIVVVPQKTNNQEDPKINNFEHINFDMYTNVYRLQVLLGSITYRLGIVNTLSKRRCESISQVSPRRSAGDCNIVSVWY